MPKTNSFGSPSPSPDVDQDLTKHRSPPYSTQVVVMLDRRKEHVLVKDMCSPVLATGKRPVLDRDDELLPIWRKTGIASLVEAQIADIQSAASFGAAAGSREVKFIDIGGV